MLHLWSAIEWVAAAAAAAVAVVESECEHIPSREVAEQRPVKRSVKQNLPFRLRQTPTQEGRVLLVLCFSTELVVVAVAAAAVVATVAAAVVEDAVVERSAVSGKAGQRRLGSYFVAGAWRCVVMLMS